jgi:hypothetical protein
MPPPTDKSTTRRTILGPATRFMPFMDEHSVAKLPSLALSAYGRSIRALRQFTVKFLIRESELRHRENRPTKWTKLRSIPACIDEGNKPLRTASQPPLSLREVFAFFELAVLCLLATSTGCASSHDSLPPPSKNTIEGIWQGEMTNSRESKTKIGLLVFRSDEHLKGSYYCEDNSATCLNNNTTGTVSGSLNSTNFQVTLRDSSLCRFSGSISENHASGRYSCYMGGELIDHGSWELHQADAIEN